jgi:hypothetical protein
LAKRFFGLIPIRFVTNFEPRRETPDARLAEHFSFTQLGEKRGKRRVEQRGRRHTRESSGTGEKANGIHHSTNAAIRDAKELEMRARTHGHHAAFVARLAQVTTYERTRSSRGANANTNDSITHLLPARAHRWVSGSIALCKPRSAPF